MAQQSDRVVFLIGGDEFIATCSDALDELRPLNKHLSDRRDFLFCVAVTFCELLRPLIAELAPNKDNLDANLHDLLQLAVGKQLDRCVEGNA